MRDGSRDDAAARAAGPTLAPGMIADIVRTVSGRAGVALSTREASLLDEVEELGRTIARAKADIAALQADDITFSQIPSATDELDAIVAHTAQATDAILECCETLDQVAAGLSGEQAAALANATTRIYEACGFQDITGQRITKIVATLKAIEIRVGHILTAFGPSPAPDGSELSEPVVLLNGPQLPDAAMHQSDIDKLLASFD